MSDRVERGVTVETVADGEGGEHLDSVGQEQRDVGIRRRGGRGLRRGVERRAVRQDLARAGSRRSAGDDCYPQGRFGCAKTLTHEQNKDIIKATITYILESGHFS